MTKILNKVKIEGSDCNIIKVIYEKSISNIIVINEKLKTSKIKRKRQGCPFLILLLNIILEVLARALGQKRKQKASSWKERSKIMSVHRGHDFMCRKFFKLHTHTHTHKTCTESCMVENQHSNIFPCMNNNHSKKENKKTILFVFCFLNLQSRAK